MHCADVLDRHRVDRCEFVLERAVFTEVGPLLAQPLHAPIGALACERDAGGELVAETFEVALGDGAGDVVGFAFEDGPDLIDAGRVARCEGGEGPDAVVRVVEGLRLVREARFDERPVQRRIPGIAQRQREQRGGVAAVVAHRRRLGAHQQVRAGDAVVLERERLIPEDRLAQVALCAGGVPGAAGLAHLRNRVLEVHLPGERHDGVVRGVALGEVRAHLLTRHRVDRLVRAQHAVRERVGAVTAGGELLVERPEWLVLVHGDLFEDHALLVVEIRFAQRGAEDVREDVRRFGQRLGEDLRVEGGHLRRREGVVAGADLVELAVDVVGRTPLGALEHHVLEEVADAHDGARLVAGAGLDEESARRSVRRRVGLGDDGQAVVEGGLLEFNWHVGSWA